MSTKSLEDRREPHVPDREREHQRLGGEQPIDIGRDTPAIDSHVIVLDPVLTGHHGIEAFGVEIAIVDLMAARA